MISRHQRLDARDRRRACSRWSWAPAIDRRIPGALVALVAGTRARRAFGLHHHGVAVLGHVAHGAPHSGCRVCRSHAIGRVAPVAGIVALVVVTQSAATTRAFAAARPTRSTSGATCSASAPATSLAGLTGAFPVNASPPRTAAVRRGRWPHASSGLVAAARADRVDPRRRAAPDVPLATLAGVLMFVADTHLQRPELVAIARFDRVELALALVTLLTVALLGVEQGIGVAVALAILDRTRLSARPRLHVLGRIPGTTSWAPLPSRSTRARCRACWWCCSRRHSGTRTRAISGRSCGGDRRAAGGPPSSSCSMRWA